MVKFSKTRPTDQVNFTCYFIIEEKDASGASEANFVYYKRNQSCFQSFNHKCRKFWLDSYIMNKEFEEKSAEAVINENTVAHNIG